MDQTPNLLLPYILAAQSQKHVTHNEALRALDNVVQLTVLDRNLAAPPGAPAEGHRYIVAASPTGTWAGHTNQIAAFVDGAWLFYVPIEGWIAWIADENIALAYDGVAWVTLSGGVSVHSGLTGLLNDDHPQYLTNGRGDARYTALNPATLGVNATADATNKLTVGSSASLFNHTGTGGHQIKINKALATDTASFLFQTGFSGRAELGTTGDDDFHFKVSANGTTFNEAILINRTTGACTFPNSTLGTGTVTQVATGTGLTGGPITGSGTVSLANMAANTLKGNNTGAAAAPTDLTAAQAKTLLAIASSDVSGLAAIATSGSASNLIAGTVPAAQMPAHTGDVTSTAGSLALTIAANAVTNAKAAQMAASTLKGNNAAAAANASDLTAAQVKTLLAITSTDVSGLGALATAASVNLSTQASGTLQAAQEPAHTGDVTNTAGSLALTIANNAVTNAKAAQMAANTLKGNNTGAAANAADLTAAQVKTLLAISAATDVSGLAAIATSGSASNLIAGTVPAAQMPALTGDVTSTAGSTAMAIAANAVTNAKSAQMAASTIKGNATGATANATDLTATQVTALLNAVVGDSGAGGTKGLVPAPAAGDAAAGRFLAANGTWGLPPSASGVSDGDKGDITATAGVWAIDPNVVTNAKAAQMTANTIKGNNTNAAANANDLTAAQVAAILPAGSLERGERLTPWRGSDFDTATGPWGPFLQTLISAGTVAASATGVPTANHQGCLSITSSVTANSGALFTSNPGGILLGGGEQFDCVFKTAAAFTNITTRLGFHDCTTSADAVDGCYLEISPTGVVTGKTSSNSTRTASATIATLAVSTWYHARVKLNAGATGVDFTIFDDSGTQLGTINVNTNIPTASGRECGAGFIVTNAGAVATLSGIIDYMALGQQGRTLVRGAAS